MDRKRFSIEPSGRFYALYGGRGSRNVRLAIVTIAKIISVTAENSTVNVYGVVQLDYSRKGVCVVVK